MGFESRPAAPGVALLRGRQCYVFVVGRRSRLTTKTTIACVGVTMAGEGMAGKAMDMIVVATSVFH